jgi:hypothetical protein
VPAAGPAASRGLLGPEKRSGVGEIGFGEVMGHSESESDEKEDRKLLKKKKREKQSQKKKHPHNQFPRGSDQIVNINPLPPQKKKHIADIFSSRTN